MNKIAVLGTGPSIIGFVASDYDWSIGVNDIWKFVKSDDIVCLNSPREFNAERLRVINTSTPNAFFSQMVIWDTRPDFVKINLRLGYPDRLCVLDDIKYEKSFCSPFVAAQIAFKYYHAKEIHLFGVDLVNHPYLDRPLCGRIKSHFRNLAIALTEHDCKMIVHGEGILKNI